MPAPGAVPGVRADAVVVAAGASRRMEGVDKLAAPLAGRPLLAWTLAAIAAAREVERIVVVTAAPGLDALRGAAWLPARVVEVVPGGARRQESVAAGVAALERLDGGAEAAADRVVLVHDGARPLVSPNLVGAVARAAATYGAAVPVLPVAETLKRVAGDRIVETIERAGLAAAQTPQGVRRALLRAAYAQQPPGSAAEFTDEAALLEACRIAVHAIPGEPTNLKVTVPDDLSRVAVLLGAALVPRIGIGADRHSFGPGEPLALGGVVLAGAPRLHGHSDGDVALHAIADALLGAAGLGDLGRLFPADDRTPRGIASRELIAVVLERVAATGLRPASIDVTISAARPRLAPHLEAMGTAIAGMLGLEPARVNVKASTGNLSGDVGAGRAISAQAVAVLEARS